MPNGEDLEAWPTSELNPRAFNTMIPGRVFGDSTAQIESLSMSRNGQMTIVSTISDQVWLYDLEKSARARTVWCEKYGAAHVRFIVDAKTAILASTKGDHRISYLDLVTINYSRYYTGHEGRIIGLHTSPKDDLFLSISEDQTIRFWEPLKEESLGTISLPSTAVAEFDPTGSIFGVGCGGKLRLYDLKSYHYGPFLSVDIPTDDWVAMRFSPAGDTILISTNTDKLLLLDAFTGAIKHVLQGHLNTTRLHLKGSFSPDARYVVCGSSNKHIHIWSTETAQIVHTFERSPHEQIPLLVEWNPAFISFLSAGKKLVLWNPVLEDMEKED